MNVIKRLISSALVFSLISVSPSFYACAAETNRLTDFNESIGSIITFLKKIKLITTHG